MRFFFSLVFSLSCLVAFSQKWYPYRYEDGKTHWMTLDQKLSIPASSIAEIKDDWLVITGTGKKGMINENGKLVIDTNYTSLEKIGDSLISFSLTYQTRGIDTLVEAPQSNYSYPRLLIPDNRFGLMDLNGKIVLPAFYSRFRKTQPNSKGDFLILCDQIIPVHQQLDFLNTRGYFDTYRTRLLSPGGKMLSSEVFSEFYRQSEFMYAGIMTSDSKNFKESYMIPQPSRTYLSGCISTDYQVASKPAYNYYPRIILYNNQLNEITHFWGSHPVPDQKVMDGTDKRYYVDQDKLIDSVEIFRTYIKPYDQYPGRYKINWKNDPCKYQAEEELPIQIERFKFVKKNAFGSLYSVFSERGHCLLNENMDTVLFSAENHFFKRADTPEDIHIKTCAGKWGLADTLGNILIPVVSDSMILHGKYFSRTWQNGKEVWLDHRHKSIDLKNVQVILPYRFPVVNNNEEKYSIFIQIKSLKTNKYGLMDTSGKIVVPAIYDNIFTEKHGFWMRKNTKKGFIVFDGKNLKPVQYNVKLVSDYVTCSSYFDLLRQKWIPESPEKHLLILNKAKKQGIVSMDKKIILPAKYVKVTALYPDSIYLVADSASYKIYNVNLRKFVAGPFAVDTVSIHPGQYEGESKLISIENGFAGETGTIRTDGTWVRKPSLIEIESEYGTYRIIRRGNEQQLTDYKDRILVQGFKYFSVIGARTLHIAVPQEGEEKQYLFYFYDLARKKLYPTDCSDLSQKADYLEGKLILGQNPNGWNLYDSNYRKVLEQDFDYASGSTTFDHSLMFSKGQMNYIYSLKNKTLSKPYQFVSNGTSQIVKYQNAYDILSAEGEIMMEGFDDYAEGTSYFWFRKGKTTYWMTKDFTVYKVIEK